MQTASHQKYVEDAYTTTCRMDLIVGANWHGLTGNSVFSCCHANDELYMPTLNILCSVQAV